LSQTNIEKSCHFADSTKIIIPPKVKKGKKTQSAALNKPKLSMLVFTGTDIDSESHNAGCY
jgi:hypothetical protein